MRNPTVMLVAVIAVSVCGGGATVEPPVTSEATVTTEAPDTTLASEHTTTTLGTTTTQAPESTTTTKAPIMGGVTTRHDDGCAYEGPTEFDVNSEVTFTFINASEILNAGFAVHKVDEGTTTEDILKLGVFAVSDEETDVYSPYLPSGMNPDLEYPLTVTLDRIGLHALICFQFPEGRPHHANLFTVTG